MARNRGLMRMAGTRAFTRRLTHLSRIAQRAGVNELKQLGEEVMDESKARAPELTGALVDSHRLEVNDDPSAGSTAIEINVGPVYDEKGEEYSFKMHEGLDGRGEVYNLGVVSRAKNDGKPHVGKGVGMKFLERAFRAKRREALRRLSKAVGKKL